MAENQSVLGLKSINKFWVLEKCKSYEIDRRMYDVYREACFSPPKCLQIGETWICRYDSGRKRQSIEWKQTDSPVRKRFRPQQSAKKLMPTVFWHIKGHIMNDFF